MKKQLTLSREQGKTLYNLISGHDVPNRSDNRKRFRFLDIIEDFVFEYDDLIDEINLQITKENSKDLFEAAKELGKESKKFIFPDREIFSKVKDMFEACYKTGNKSRSESGQVISKPLSGRSAKIYTELEDAFADVVDIKEKK